MKINKLLLFLLALVSLNSCVEYVDNGVVPEGPEKPEEQVFVAKLSEESEGEFVGDEFIFEATLNGVDVTSATTFKVNGVDAKGNVFKAIKEGENAVLATMDDFTSTFRFTVKEKGEEEPEEPTGNRIEYGPSDWKPVTNTFWAITVDAQDVPQPYNYKVQGTDVLCTRWLLISADESNPANISKAANVHYMLVYVPADMTDPNAPALLFPHEAQTLYTDGGYVTFDGNANQYNAESNTYSFVSGTMPQSGGVGTADYTSSTGLENNPNLAKLFWNGSYSILSTPAPSPKGAKSNSLKLDAGQIKNLNLKRLNNEQIKNLKIAK